MGRGYLPAGSLDAAAFAEDYPAEAWLTIVGTCATRQDDQAKAYMALCRDAVNLYARGGGVENSSLPLAKLNLGWVGAIARAYEAAGEVTGAKSEATWQQPPAGK